jgi:CRISPR/Cas system endoribonuclease Cas6 (RAMP superfamily)
VKARPRGYRFYLFFEPERPIKVPPYPNKILAGIIYRKILREYGDLLHDLKKPKLFTFSNPIILGDEYFKEPGTGMVTTFYTKKLKSN